jgi:hypothetical protein
MASADFMFGESSKNPSCFYRVMKRFALLSLVVFLAACGSSGVSNGPHARLLEPELQIRQVVGPPELGFPTGQMEVKFNIRVENRSGEPLSLKKLDLSSSNPEGGAYTVIHRSYFPKMEIGPNQTGSIDIWVRAYGWGRGMRESEPVTLHGAAYFDSPAGYVNLPFVREVGQYAGQND